MDADQKTVRISQIYRHYKIMPTLQLHQLRVAAVAKCIATNCKEKIDENSLIAGSLLHDMGNIIKFDLTLYPEFLEPEGLEYWDRVQNSYKDLYGEDEHAATNKIAKEIGVTDEIYKVIDSIGFSHALKLVDTDNFTYKIACYSDHRVSPAGVRPLKERIEDGNKRFVVNKRINNPEKFMEKTNYIEKEGAMFKLEEQIFEVCSISADDIIEEKIEPIIEELKEFEVKVVN